MRGLALSGGAAFGAYQAGVWETLAESGWKPDLVAGISIGAVNAFLISRDAGPEEMRRAWLDLPGRLLPCHRAPFAFPWRTQAGLFQAWLRALVAEFGPRRQARELMIVLLDASEMRVTRLDGRERLTETLLAACALPGVFAPVKVGERYFMDCGFVRRIPTADLWDRGCDDIVGVDLLKVHPMPLAGTALRSISTVRRFLSGARPCVETAAGARPRIIGHGAPLGTVLESFRWSRQSAERLLRMSREDAREALSGAVEHAA